MLTSALLGSAQAEHRYPVTDDSREVRPYGRGVNRADAIDSLPETYAAALRLRDAGAGRDEIAHSLQIEPTAVASTLELADAKFARLLASGERGPPELDSEQSTRGTP